MGELHTHIAASWALMTRLAHESKRMPHGQGHGRAVLAGDATCETPTLEVARGPCNSMQQGLARVSTVDCAPTRHLQLTMRSSKLVETVKAHAGMKACENQCPAPS
jgi:hypothetical protein